MRRFIRFMGEAELEKYLKGKELINETIHNGRIKGSFSFCFFDQEKIDPITANHLLMGIATLDYMVEFIVEDDIADKVLTKSKGAYHLPNAPLTKSTVLEEYCTKTYSRKDFMPYQIWHLMMKYPVINFSDK